MVDRDRDRDTNRGPGSASGTSTMPVDTDVPKCSVPRRRPSWEQLHDAAEWNWDAGYAAGFDAGLAAANRAMTRLLDEWTGGWNSAQLTPPPSGAADVVSRMLRAMRGQIMSRRAAEVRAATTDYPGGRAPVWDDDEARRRHLHLLGREAGP